MIPPNQFMYLTPEEQSDPNFQANWDDRPAEWESQRIGYLLVVAEHVLSALNYLTEKWDIDHAVLDEAEYLISRLRHSRAYRDKVRDDGFKRFRAFRDSEKTPVCPPSVVSSGSGGSGGASESQPEGELQA